MTFFNSTSIETGSARSPDAESPKTDKLASAAHSAVDAAADQLAKAEHALKEARATAGFKMTNTAEQAWMISADAKARVRGYIHRFPVRSLGIALGTGYVVSALLRKDKF
jgi:ElaB/YqjD/DUF883 family membrane-anchored ribosome-binding protein